MAGPLARLPRLSTAATRRVSSYDRSGGNRDFITLAPGETAVLAEIDRPGAITHLWFTLSSPDPLHKRACMLRMFWDGGEHPSVEAPIGDFFGQGWALHYPFASLPLAAAQRDGRALVGYFPMPFASARIELENQSAELLSALYFYIDYEERDVDADEGRFHAWYNQELTFPVSEHGDVEDQGWMGRPEPKNPSDAGNYVLLDCEGRGHFVGVNYYVHSPTPIWYGEGDDMFMVDGEPWPGSAHGTGTEDYFNTAWSPELPFQHPYFGLARVPGVGNDDPRFGWLGRAHCYRFHIEDPIRFQRSLRVSIEHGHANALTLELASVAYWYQTLPHKPFPPLPPYADRVPKPLIAWEDVHHWRDAWRNATGGVWGNER